MLGSEGFIIHFDEDEDEDERSYYINEGFYGPSFTDALSVPDWDIKKHKWYCFHLPGQQLILYV